MGPYMVFFLKTKVFTSFIDGVLMDCLHCYCVLFTFFIFGTILEGGIGFSITASTAFTYGIRLRVIEYYCLQTSTCFGSLQPSEMLSACFLT